MKKILVLITSVSLLNGCATMTLIGQTTKHDEPSYHKMDDDIIRQIAVPTKDGKKVEGLVLLGDKYTYLIDTGATQLVYMAKLNPNFIEMPEMIDVNVSDKQSIQSAFSFKYKSMSGNYTSDEEEILNHIACSTEKVNNFSEKKFYTCRMRVYGKLYAPKPEVVEQYRLNQGRKIKLQTVTYKDKKDYGQLLGLPLSLAFDVVTLPLQLLWTGGALVHNKN